MQILKDYLKDFEIEFSEARKNSEFDLTIKIFKEIKKGKKPEDISKKILENIKEFVDKHELINGYLNIKLKYDRIIKEYKKLLDFKDIEKKSIIIEHTSVNPNKALHIGHLRNAILGDSLNRLLSFLGNKVTILNYIDDTGSQVADIVVGFYYLGFSQNPDEFNEKNLIENLKKYVKNLKEEEIIEIIKSRKNSLKNLYGYEIPKKFDHYCGDFVYVIINKLYEKFPEIEKLKKEVLKKIEEGNNEIYFFSQNITRKIILDQLKTLWNFDIYYDLLNKESDIIKQGFWDKVFSILKEKNIIRFESEGDKKGTWIIDLSRWKEFDGYEDKKKVLVRSDGTTVYLAKDIAYAFWKLNIIQSDFKYSVFSIQPNGKILYETSPNGEIDNFKFNDCDVSINVIGAEQSYLQLIIKKIIEDMYPNKTYIHYKYNLVMLSKDTARIFGIDNEKKLFKMSGRKGIFINADNLLEKTKEFTYKKLIERGFNEEEAKKLAFYIARSTICFEILKYDTNSIVAFDINRMTNIEEGNALYLMYTYARILSLIEKSGIDEKEIEKLNKFSIDNLNEYEKRLILKLFLFKDIILETYKSLEINKLAKYAVDLAKIFNEFYQNVPIIPEISNKPYRLFLVFLTKKILENLFYILKIDTVRKI
ncbi:MAG: arginine--tRNA ligase [Nanopusillaceae archaeon]